MSASAAVEALTPLNIAHHLPAQAQARPFARAVVVPAGRARDGRRAYAQATFAQLDALADGYARALVARGVARGDRVLLLVRPGVDLVAVLYAVFKVGAVAVFVDPGMGLGNLVRCVEHVGPRWFIGVSAAQAALALFGRRALRSVQGRLLVGRGFGFGARRLTPLEAAAGRPGAGDGGAREPAAPFALAPTGADETAAILFTSGSTGPAKGVVYSHGMFDAQVRLLREEFGIEPGEVDLPGLPIFALFSVALGVTTVFPDMDPTRPAALDPAAFVAAIQDHGVTYSFGSPAIWRPVSAYCLERGIRLPSLRRVLMAGAPVEPALHERLRQVLGPDADTHTPYGATEALPIANVRGRELEETFAATRAGAGVCVGKPLPGVSVRVIAVTDEPLARWEQVEVLAPGERGELVVTGPSVTREYSELPEATAAAKVREGERTWHRMGDLGWIDEQGRVWFCGRKSHRVETAAGRLLTVCCEAIFNAHPAVARTALVGLGPRGAQTPVIVVELAEGTQTRGGAAREALVRELRALGAEHAHTAGIEAFLFHPRFPVDVRHNAKIRREDLARWASERLPAARP